MRAGLEGDELVGAPAGQCGVGDGDRRQDIESGGDVNFRCVQRILDAHAVDRAQVLQAALARAVTIHRPIKDEGVKHGTKLPPQALTQSRQVVAGEFGFHEGEIEAGVEHDDGDVRRHGLSEDRGDLLKHLDRRPALGARPLSGHAVNRCRGGGDLDPRIRQPHANPTGIH